MAETRTVNEIPAWIDAASQDIYNRAKRVGERPYTPYGGKRIASWSPTEQTAFGLVDGGYGFAPLAQREHANFQQADPMWLTQWQQADPETVRGSDLAGYVDPNLSFTLGEIRRQGEIDRNQIGVSARKTNPYGRGTRAAVVEGMQREGEGRTVAAATQAAWQRAQDLAGSDADRINTAAARNLEALLGVDARQAELDDRAAGRNLTAALQTDARNVATSIDIDKMNRALEHGDLATLLQIGGMARGKEQANLELAYSDYLRELGYPDEAINRELSTLKGTPYSTTQTTNGPGPNTFAQNLGAFGTAVGGIGLAAKSGAFDWLGRLFP